jgi:hypothetical protein
MRRAASLGRVPGKEWSLDELIPDEERRQMRLNALLWLC